MRAGKLLGQLLAGLASASLAVILGTIAHQTTLSGFPFGLTLAMFLVGLTALQLRRNRGIGSVYVVFLAVGLFLIGQAANQDVMIPANLYGYIWSYGSIALAALITMWPKFKN